ncbi:MAG TPA: SIS domain-containing protein [Clostridiaceae bacterium]|nr:SIS domain-containing protein [Clostridiaceae bacterium]
MGNMMREYINEQPDILKKIMESSEEGIKLFLDKFRDFSIERIYLFGSGSSYNAACMAKPFMEHVLKVEVTPMTPTQIYNIDWIKKNRSIRIALSQSGRSTNTFSLVQMLEKDNYGVVSLTANPQSEIARLSSLHIEISCGEEKAGPKTKGVTSTVLMLYLLTINLAYTKKLINIDEYNSYLDLFKRTIYNLPDNINRSICWYKANKIELSRAKCIFIIAKDLYSSAALEGALKLDETIYKPVFAYEFEEFIHGINCLLGSDNNIIFLISGEDNNERIYKLCDFSEKLGDKVYIISTEEQSIVSSNRLQLMSVHNKYMEPFEFVIPMQVLSSYLSEYLGNDIDKPKFKNFSAIMESKIQ